MTLTTSDETIQLRVVAPRPDCVTGAISTWALRRYRGGNEVLHSANVGEGERLNELFEARCDRYQRARQGRRLAVETADESLTYKQLDELANQTARYLVGAGIGPGDRVGLLFDRSVWSFASMLAVMKVGAVYVPMDKMFPVDRIQFIMEDSDISTILSVSRFGELLGDVGADVIYLDQQRSAIETESRRRFRSTARLSGHDLAYIIYTSGSTGRPKGVPITHTSICNFVEVAAEVYGLNPDDRVYQGLTLAFDFAVEEIWVPLVVGATLVPAPSDITLIGPDLSDFLRVQRVTAMCCVPTLLATIDADLPDLTFLLVSGEACPEELANRWHAEGRRFLNVYGPTEATVTATWIELTPEGQVTIGGPLPTYSIVILDPDEARALNHGEVGEIGIAGPGLAPGYLNRDDKTRAAFIPDFIGIENNPSGRIYRTGDLGRINDDHEIEYMGRIDTQVKIRGYRIELEEIDSVLLQAPGVAQAVVIDHTPASGVTELAAYYTVRDGADPVTVDDLHAVLSDRLPPYMVPSTFQELDELPMLPSHKVDRRRLPEPGAKRIASISANHAEPIGDTERRIAAVFAKVLGLEAVSTTDNFFDDLGASSLLLAHVCTELRGDSMFADVSVKDLYFHPTITELANIFSSPGEEVPGPSIERDPPHRATRRQHLTCGALQFAWILLGIGLAATAVGIGGRWVLDAPGAGSALARGWGLGLGLLLGATMISVLLKWILIGRWKAEKIPVWSFRYFRYWAAKATIRTSPLRLFAGSPLYNVCLRLLGAKVGRRVTILSGSVPICTDMLTIGDDVVIRDGSSFTGCKAEDGYIVTGGVTIDDHGHVGEATVLDVDTAIGTFATIGHKSSLHQGQRIPNFRTWHGSPAQPTSTDYRTVSEDRSGAAWRRIAYSIWRVATIVSAVAVVSVLGWLIFNIIEDERANLFAPLPGTGVVEDSLGFALAGTVLFAAVLILGMVPMMVLPRLVSLLIKPNRTYRLYGLRHQLAQIGARTGNSAFYNSLFGDSSSIVRFLRLIGYDLDDPIQTGVNFGLAQRQGNPKLCRVGRGTMISDGLTMMNYDYSATSFTCSPVAIGAGSFLGNDVHIPAQAKIGDNCLLATKVMVPIEGEVRSDVGLLGSPAFEIPRATDPEDSLGPYRDPVLRSKRLSQKLRDNVVTMAGFVAVRYVLALIGFVAGFNIFLRRDSFSNAEMVLLLVDATVVLIVFAIFLAALVEWLGLAFRRLEPQQCSIYDPYYWYHERHWKWGRVLPGPLFSGTPFQPLIWRLIGVRIGARVLDEGCQIPERSLTSIGDDVCLNEGSVIQGHSLEDGLFKSDRVTIANSCTVGVAAFVHYGTTMENRALLDADAFLLKGETIPEGATWSGNPAGAVKQLPAWAPPEAATVRQ